MAMQKEQKIVSHSEEALRRAGIHREYLFKREESGDATEIEMGAARFLSDIRCGYVPKEWTYNYYVQFVTDEATHLASLLMEKE